MNIMLPILSLFIMLSLHGMELSLTETPAMQLTVEYAYALWQNPIYKMYQEDKITHIQLSKGHFFSVYDGHMSERSDNNVSSFLQNNFHRLFEQSKKETIKEKFEDAFYQAEIHALKNFSDGSTAIIAYIDEEQVVHFAWVGDSRAALEKNKTTAYETQDHNPFSNKPELKRIEEHNLFIQKPYIYNKNKTRGLSMTRSIGDRAIKDVTDKEPLGIGGIIAKPEYHAIQLTPENKFLILASDGLWYDVESTEAVALITAFQTDSDTPLSSLPKGQPDCFISSPACDESIKNALRELGIGSLFRGSQDNIAILIAQLKWQEMRKEKM